MNETYLYVDFQACRQEQEDREALAGAHGLVVDPAAVSPEEAEGLRSPVRVLRSTDSENFAAWREQQGIIGASDGGLEHCARMRDAWPELTWVPQLSVFKPQVRYQLLNTFPGEGFKVYMPDTAAIGGYQVKDSEATLDESLVRAAELGFQTLWLHALDADAKGTGLDLELLERAHRRFRGRLWLSGGATAERHLANLATQGAALAVVVPASLASRCGCERLRRVLVTAPHTRIPRCFVANTTCPSTRRA